MPINIIFTLISFLPVILGIIMVSHNTYKFFGNHPELGFDTVNKATLVASLVFLVSILVTAPTHFGAAGASSVFALLVSLAYVIVALYYLKKWLVMTFRTTHDELTERASTLNSASFQKTAMGLTALLLSSGKSTDTTTREQRAEIHERIKHARVFDHLPTNTLIGYFEESLSAAEHPVCMYAWDNTLNQIKRNATKQYETDIALQVALKLVGGKDVSTINQERLSCIVNALGLEKSKYLL